VSTRDIVLVVEDTPASLGLLNETLEQAGFTVLLAANGERALDILEQITPHAILMDALLPGEDGFETTRRIRSCSRLADVPVIFMTGLTDTAHVVEALESGGVDYVTKPIDPAELVARLRVHVLNARASRDSRAALDVSGQYIIAVDTRGVPRWLTPRAREILFAGSSAKDLPDGTPHTRRLPEEVVLWIAQGGPDPLTLLIEERMLTLEYIGPASDDEFLIRVLDGEMPDSQAILRDAFGLTTREAEVLGWVVNGKSNKEAAAILSISPRTVNKHLDNVYVKLGVENRTAAAIVAIRKIVGDAYRPVDV